MDKTSKKSKKGGDRTMKRHNKPAILLSIAIPFLFAPSFFSSAFEYVGSFVALNSYAEEATQEEQEDQFVELGKQLKEEIERSGKDVQYTLVVYELPKVLSTRVVKSYNAVEGQTDKNNCDGAFSPRTGINFCETKISIVATNELPLGTIVKIDGKVFLVADRTHERYKYLYDILTPTYEEAIEWGKQYHEVEIVGKVVKNAS